VCVCVCVCVRVCVCVCVSPPSDLHTHVPVWPIMWQFITIPVIVIVHRPLARTPALQYGYLARVLHPEGTTLRVGEPIALVCDEEEELSHWAAATGAGAAAADGGGGELLASLEVPAAAFERSFSWQAYVKRTDADALGGCGGCG
jgi:hypothetical protein